MTPEQGSSAEKTEKATPKKRRDARKKGQVLKSAEVNTAVLTLSMFMTLFLAGGWMMQRLFTLFGHCTDLMARTESHNDKLITQTLFDIFISFFLILLPFLSVALIMGILVNVAQIGFLFVSDPLKPKLSKINPISGLKRIFSMRSLMEMFKAIAKFSAVGLVVYFEYVKNLELFPMMMHLSPANAASELFSMCMVVAFKACVVLVFIGLLDYMYQWWEYEKNLKMTKDEVKREFKQMEGDPQIKGKRREQQRKMSMMRMMQAVPQADVVITNPTHYAVAIKYEEKKADAPIVLAKGKDAIALKIKQLAQESGIELVENKPVAQALYAACEPGQKIPPDLFAAVAEILAHVYNLKKQQQDPPRPGQRRPIQRSPMSSNRQMGGSFPQRRPGHRSV
ncbi:MAG: flagellar biosynthesis protein FlhB [Oscillospiraceae bacterium]|nr:flagellar biosynthesis protein FlhB [Oscillospiraceae bacterium]